MHYSLCFEIFANNEFINDFKQILDNTVLILDTKCASMFNEDKLPVK
jgi:hypothetical protein